jgi:hypothetical protein
LLLRPILQGQRSSHSGRTEPRGSGQGAFCAQEVDELALRREDGFHAGRYRIGYQACDDSRPSEGADPAQCAANARAFALDTSVIGVIGAYDSGCTGIELPTLNAAPSGGDRRAPRS